MEHSQHAAHGMGPALLGWLYLAAILVALLTHLFNLWQAGKLLSAPTHNSP